MARLEKKPSLGGGAAHSFAAVQVYVYRGDYILPSNINHNNPALIEFPVISPGCVYLYAHHLCLLVSSVVLFTNVKLLPP